MVAVLCERYGDVVVELMCQHVALMGTFAGENKLSFPDPEAHNLVEERALVV